MIGFRWKKLVRGIGHFVPALRSHRHGVGCSDADHGIHGGAGATYLVLDPSSDAYLVGGKQVIETLRSTNPKLDTLLVSSMVSMCAQTDGLCHPRDYRHLVRNPAWPGLGPAAALVQVPYYAVITSIYAAQGAPLGGTVSLFPFVVGHSSR